MKRKPVVLAILLTALLAIMVAVALSVGAVHVQIRDIIRILMSYIPFFDQQVSTAYIPKSHETIIMAIRLPRILLAGLVGCGLSLSGAVLQGVLRNPLADPQVLGISSGAAFGAAVAISFGFTYSAFGLGGIAGAAFVGALATIFCVWKISFSAGKSSLIGILLAGIAISSLLTSAITMIMVLDREKLEKVYMWMLGSFSAASEMRVIFMLIFVVLGLLAILPLSRALDLMMTGDDSAQSMGVDVEALRKWMILVSSLMVAACVSVSGIIGFVGLIIPHVVRLIAGPRHTRLLPLSCVVGAIFMIICDTLARTMAAPSEIPVGAITAILGAPYFLFLLARSARKGAIR